MAFSVCKKINVRTGWLMLGLLCLSLLTSCGSDLKVGMDEFMLQGKLKNSRGELIRLQLLSVDSLSTIDSVVVDNNGAFSFKSSISEPGFYLLGTKADNFITLLIDQGEDITIEADAMQLASDYSVNGSPGSQLLWELNDHTRMNYRKSDSLMQLLNASQAHLRFDSIKTEIDSTYTDIYNNQKTFLQGFIQKNSTSLASLMALYQVFGRIRMINEREDAALFEKLDNDLLEKYPENLYVAELHERVTVLKKEKTERLAFEKKLDSGNVAPAIQLNTPAGAPITLSSLKGNVILLHFWATWSAPSQAGITTYKYLQKKYAPKGFTVFSVSLDKDRQSWEMGIRENKMYWPQGSDLREWESPLVKTYNIATIPSTFLIDKDGRIILKRPDDQTLMNYLARYYKF